MISCNFCTHSVRWREQMWLLWKREEGVSARPQVSPYHRCGLCRTASRLRDALFSRVLHWTSHPPMSAASTAFSTFSKMRGKPRVWQRLRAHFHGCQPWTWAVPTPGTKDCTYEIKGPQRAFWGRQLIGSTDLRALRRRKWRVGSSVSQKMQIFARVPQGRLGGARQFSRVLLCPQSGKLA